MRYSTLLKLPILLLFALVLFSCEKDPEPTIVPTIATLTTLDPSSITNQSAVTGGNITNEGGGKVTARGVCWSTKSYPTTSDLCVEDKSSGIGVFECKLSNLEPSKTYHIRAYATNSFGTAYGNDITLTTIIVLPTVSTGTTTAIKNSSARSEIVVLSDGGAPITNKGICWSTKQNPTITDSLTTNGDSILTKLLPNSTYYARAYATNSVGTAYGNQVEFSTPNYKVPVVETTTVSNIKITMAICGGNITDDGLQDITQKGVVWSTLENPTIEVNNGITNEGTGNGIFESNVTHLKSGTTYYVRSYAKNAMGVSYGAQKSFRTYDVIELQDMVFVEGGTFNMGRDRYESSSPVHSVFVNDFYIAKFEVTQKLWLSIMGTNPSFFSGTNLPVEQISWDDAQLFIAKLNEQNNLHYRLPTEAEWEYAARGGVKASIPSLYYSGSNLVDEVSWHRDNANQTTHEVGTKKANELGIYDMSGNVQEWCSDWYGSYSDIIDQTNNPIGPATGTDRILRGGSWNRSWNFSEVCFRCSWPPSENQNIFGLRLVATVGAN